MKKIYIQSLSEKIGIEPFSKKFSNNLFAQIRLNILNMIDSNYNKL